MLRYVSLVVALAVGTAAAQSPTRFSSPLTQPRGVFGTSVSDLPDVDGDGVADIVIGAPLETVGADLFAGRAYVYSGATGTLLHTLVSPAVQADAQFGYAVLGLPDSDGDGFGEIVVTAPRHNLTDIFGADAPNAGTAYLFSGATGTLIEELSRVNFSGGFGDAIDPQGAFGASIARVPLLTVTRSEPSDGFVIGAPGNGSSGAAYTYELDGYPSRRYVSPSPNAGAFGTAVGGVPDANGDGYGDIVVGDPAQGGSPTGSGAAYVFAGRFGALIATLEPGASVEFGQHVAGVPDLDGDGAGDAVIVSNESVEVFSGATGARLRALEAPTGESAFGISLTVAGLPDVDGDGRGDLVVGAPNADDGAVSFAGRVYIYSGATGRALRLVASTDVQQQGFFGRAVARWDRPGGEVGFLVGAIGEVDGGEASGQAYSFRESTAGTALAGPEGWRLLAAPVLGPLQDLLAGIRTQGASGSSVGSDGDPNVYRYDESVAGGRGLGYVAPPTLAAPAETGRGYAVYVFEDDDPYSSGTQGGFPKSLALTGLGADISDVPLPVTFTPSGSVQEDGWNLVGNPYAVPVDWDASAWLKTRVDNVIYVYDAQAGSYRTWNGTTGSLGDGTVAAFQGFWVKASAEDPELVAPREARAPSATPPVAASVLALTVEGTADGAPVADGVYVSFQEGAANGLDRFDAYELAPFAARYAALYARVPNGEGGVSALDVTALPPLTAGRAEVALDLAVGGTGGAFTLRWPDLSGLPSDWELRLHDTETGTVVDLRTETSYVIPASSGASARTASLLEPPVPRPLLGTAQARAGDGRLVLTVVHASAVDAEPSAEGAFGVERVWPNPMRARGVVAVRQPVAGPSRLALYDALGREVAVVSERTRPAGRHELAVDVSGLAPGVYVARWQAGDRVASERITVLR